MRDLKGVTVLITGASSGFGEGTAYSFAKEGAKLILTARNKDKLEKVREKCLALGGEAVICAGDAREETTASEVVELALKTYGELDILINNAGIGRVHDILHSDMDEYDLVMDTNVRSAYAFSLYGAEVMAKQKHGHIILVSSVTGIYGRGEESAYTASKFALRGLGQSLNESLLPYGIMTTVFCPHAGNTEFEIGYGRDKEEWAAKHFLTPADVGNALVSVAEQTDNCYVAELRLASKNVVYR